MLSADVASRSHRSSRATCQSGRVKDVVDLDLAVIEIERRTGAWRSAGITVGDLTWRDVDSGWPATLKTDRRQVVTADSIGIRLEKGEQEGEVVLFKGGWCDLIYWSGAATDQPIQDAPGYPDRMTVDGFGAVLDRLANLFS